MCTIFGLFWGSFQQYCSNWSTKAFLWPYVSYMVGKLLTWELIICGVKDFLLISKRLSILMTARDSNEGYISKCILTAFQHRQILKNKFLAKPDFRWFICEQLFMLCLAVSVLLLITNWRDLSYKPKEKYDRTTISKVGNINGVAVMVKKKLNC